MEQRVKQEEKDSNPPKRQAAATTQPATPHVLSTAVVTWVFSYSKSDSESYFDFVNNAMEIAIQSETCALQ